MQAPRLQLQPDWPRSTPQCESPSLTDNPTPEVRSQVCESTTYLDPRFASLYLVVPFQHQGSETDLSMPRGYRMPPARSPQRSTSIPMPRIAVREGNEPHANFHPRRRSASCPVHGGEGIYARQGAPRASDNNRPIEVEEPVENGVLVVIFPFMCQLVGSTVRVFYYATVYYLIQLTTIYANRVPLRRKTAQAKGYDYPPPPSTSSTSTTHPYWAEPEPATNSPGSFLNPNPNVIQTFGISGGNYIGGDAAVDAWSPQWSDDSTAPSETMVTPPELFQELGYNRNGGPFDHQEAPLDNNFNTQHIIGLSIPQASSNYFPAQAGLSTTSFQGNIPPPQPTRYPGPSSGRVRGETKCPVCEKHVRRPGVLNDHINSHTGEKPHVCRRCGQTFTTKSNKMRHISHKHEGRE